MRGKFSWRSDCGQPGKGLVSPKTGRGKMIRLRGKDMGIVAFETVTKEGFRIRLDTKPSSFAGECDCQTGHIRPETRSHSLPILVALTGVSVWL